MNNTMIEAGELPRKIALYLEPPQPDKDWLSSVIRRTVLGEKHYQDDDLKSNADVDLLIRIGSAAQITFLDLMNGDCGHDCFDSYMRVFNESPLKPDWTLVPKFNNYEKEAEIRRHRIRMDHFGLIEESARRGEIKLLTRNRTPTFRIDPGVLISQSDAHKYLDSIGLPVDLLDAKVQTGQAEVPKEGPERDEQIYKRFETLKNKAAVGREFGISGERVAQIIERHEEKMQKARKDKALLQKMTGIRQP